MNDADWIAWSQSHATMFALRMNEDLDMIASWRPILDQFSRAELETASRELIKNPPQFRDKHVAGLLRILHHRRGELARQFAQQTDLDEEARLRCGVCKGTGAVVVPHPKCMIQGEFVAGPAGYKTTAAVTCTCARGMRKQSTYTGEIRPMTLAEYERKCGAGWPQLLDDWEEEKRRLHGVTAHAREIDKKRGPIQQLADSFRSR